MTRPLAANDRLLALRTRPDLIASPVELAGETTWVVKDPLTTEHFQFTAQEFAIIQRLRLPASIADLTNEFASRFPPQTISAEAVWDFIRGLHAAGLTYASGPGQGSELLSRRRRDAVRRRATAWMRILAIRFRGVDPDALITRLHAVCRWMFSPWALLAAAAVVLYAGALVIGEFDELLSRLPDLEALADYRNLPWLLGAVGLVKVLHELAHALACKHFGGEVRELGFMLLAFSPCLYCDVSDAWRFPGRWQRIAVSAAGIVVELLLAAAATVVWWHAQPGVVELLALNVMVVASAGTILVNGNPLLRYDGYYVLSDLVGQPNLWQRSREALRGFFARWLLGQPPREDPLLRSRGRGWLGFYALASKAYVAVVCSAIVWGLVLLLYPLHLQLLAYGLGLIMLGSAVYPPVAGAARLVANPIRRREFPARRAAAVSTLAVALSVVVLAWPVNYFIRAPLVLMPVEAARVFSSVDGALVSMHAPGESISAGETLATLENSSVDLELARLEGELREQELRVLHLDRLRGMDPAAGEKLPAARALLASQRERLSQRRRDAQRLRLVAPVDGVVLAAPRSPTRDGGGRLPTWSGALHDHANRGALVEPLTLVGLVGDPQRLSAVVIVEDADATRLQVGQPARVRLAQLPGQVLTGQVVEFSKMAAASTQLDQAGHTLDRLFAGITRPGDRRAHYQVRVDFLPPSQPLVIGGRGEAKIAAENITLARRLFRWVGRTFRLPL